MFPVRLVECLVSGAGAVAAAVGGISERSWLKKKAMKIFDGIMCMNYIIELEIKCIPLNNSFPFSFHSSVVIYTMRNEVSMPP